jgi:predicted MFS family arabinose efflux permease
MAEDSSVMARLLEESKEKEVSWFDSITGSPYWNIVLLALAWSWTLTTSTLLTTIGPLCAVQLGTSDSLAAFTIGIFLIGAAVSSVPSAYMFRTMGRFGGFSVGCMAQISGSVLGVMAMEYNDKYCLYMGCFCVGLGQGLGQFYRFSAVETSPTHLKSRAVTYVLSGGVIAAFLGPTSADQTVDFAGKPYVGSFATMAIIGVLNELTIMLVNFPKAPKVDEKSAMTVPLVENTKRSVSQIISQPLFIVSCAVATLAHTIMVMLMSNVTLAMKDNHYSLKACSLVMELHFFSMFAPGFYTGFLIKKHGTFVVALSGGLIFAASIVVLAVSTESWNYFVGMILLGAGWNFSFSSGTVMLTSSYRSIEAPDVQAVNDVILFTVAGGGSLLSGVIFQAGGRLYFHKRVEFSCLILFYFDFFRMVVINICCLWDCK